MVDIERIEYEELSGDYAIFNNQKLLEECSRLYSAHYGYWSHESSHSPSKRIKLSANRIRDWLETGNADLCMARLEGKLIAYAIVIRSKQRISINSKKESGNISWVTQLVVHEDYRNQGIAKDLLFSIWSFSNDLVWGLITANPYAIRALEKATRRRCSPERIKRNKDKLRNIAIKDLSYYKIGKSTPIKVGEKTSKINTEFFVDHSQVPEMMEKASANGIPWELGNLDEGWEWFAFTFGDQDQMELANEEIKGMVRASAQIAKQAYSRMLLNKDHKWSRGTPQEVEFIVKNCGLTKGARVLDVGCGLGRHAMELARKNLNVVGIDYVLGFIQKAEREAQKENLQTVEFIVGDAREGISSDTEWESNYDAVICLYDVIGSFIDDTENKKILETIAKSMKQNAKAVITVMNHQLTEKRAWQKDHVFSFESEPNRLRDLKPSGIMETNGNIFDPEYYLVDKDTHIVYRREQFTGTKEKKLSKELIVMDKRYTEAEITTLCQEAGLNVESVKYVNTGKWNDSLDSSEAKEIMVICTKR
uniref:Methyltransferase domain-containing protein n=1 Tax=Candidatus Kentrum sp. MB TaxID=2138164 RepID=A0A451BG86_9GAMM|nr:MAG: Methyltransferase domain-containing protein [Candidatus Kentron sp. MB]VFK77288.1 MAG: Methyltransferase domain-containing protein [Candidatus Kentron sp. MB]